MSSQPNIDHEANVAVRAALENGGVARPTWIVHAIVNTHQSIDGADTDWYRVCAYGQVRAAVRKVLQRYKLVPDDPVDSNLVLPGFERVQRAYLVSRDGEQVAVDTRQMTHGEVSSKIDELRKMSVGCALHADELERFENDRQRLAS